MPEPGPGHERIGDLDNEQFRYELHTPSGEMARPPLRSLALEPDRDVDMRGQGVALFIPGDRPSSWAHRIACPSPGPGEIGGGKICQGGKLEGELKP